MGATCSAGSATFRSCDIFRLVTCHESICRSISSTGYSTTTRLKDNPGYSCDRGGWRILKKKKIIRILQGKYSLRLNRSGT